MKNKDIIDHNKIYPSHDNWDIEKLELNQKNEFDIYKQLCKLIRFMQKNKDGLEGVVLYIKKFIKEVKKNEKEDKEFYKNHGHSSWEIFNKIASFLYKYERDIGNHWCLLVASTCISLSLINTQVEMGIGPPTLFTGVASYRYILKDSSLGDISLVEMVINYLNSDLKRIEEILLSTNLRLEESEKLFDKYHMINNGSNLLPKIDLIKSFFKSYEYFKYYEQLFIAQQKREEGEIKHEYYTSI